MRPLAAAGRAAVLTNAWAGDYTILGSRHWIDSIASRRRPLPPPSLLSLTTAASAVLPPSLQPPEAAHVGTSSSRMESEEVVLSEVHMETASAAFTAASTFTDAAGRPIVSVQHSMATPLRTVGLQVWRGALLLADLLLQRGPATFNGLVALELGAGSGLAGLVLSRLGPSVVYLTGGSCVFGGVGRRQLPTSVVAVLAYDAGVLDIQRPIARWPSRLCYIEFQLCTS